VDIEAEGSSTPEKRLLWYCGAAKGPDAFRTSNAEGDGSVSGSRRGFRRLYVLDPATLSSSSVGAYMSKLLLNRDTEDSVRSDSRVSR
jgi:hypothetical protein